MEKKAKRDDGINEADGRAKSRGRRDQRRKARGRQVPRTGQKRNREGTGTERALMPGATQGEPRGEGTCKRYFEGRSHLDQDR